MTICAGNKKRARTVALWLFAAIVTAVSFLLDDPVIAFVKAHGTPATLAAGRIGSRYGELQWLMLPCLIFAAIAFLRRNAAWMRILCAMAIASAVAGLCNDAVRGLTGRTRPNAPPAIAQGWYGPRYMLDANYNAFPSGHAAAAMGLIVPLVIMRRRIGCALMPVPIAIAAARICIGAHHLSDVMAGALVGIAAAICVDRKITPRLMRWKIF